MSFLIKILNWFKSLFSREISGSEKVTHNIANYQPKKVEIEMKKPNIIDKAGKMLSILF